MTHAQKSLKPMTWDGNCGPQPNETKLAQTKPE